MKVYAITGVEHGSIVEAISPEKAIEIFMEAWVNEEVILCKDISSYNLDNI